MSESKPHETVYSMVDDLRKWGACDCDGCIAQHLGVYEPTGNDYTLSQLIDMQGLPPANKVEIYNAIRDIAGEKGLPKAFVNEGLVWMERYNENGEVVSMSWENKDNQAS